MLRETRAAFASGAAGAAAYAAFCSRNFDVMQRRMLKKACVIGNVAGNFGSWREGQARKKMMTLIL